MYAILCRLFSDYRSDDTTEPYTGPTPDNAIVVVGYGSKKLPEVNDPR